LQFHAFIRSGNDLQFSEGTKTPSFTLVSPIEKCHKTETTSEAQLMMMCDIAEGLIKINSSTLICNETAFPYQSSIIIRGETDSNGIQIENTAPTLHFENINISSSHPFVCQSCSVSILLSGLNFLTATGDNFSGLEC
jgi:hypothetical protein